MSGLAKRRILLGVTGGIAAYKAALLVRALREQGAEVRVVMTKAAQAFITPLTMQALSGNPVHSELFDPAAEAAMGHIELARWADRVLVAPATADFMARLAHGLADDLLSTLCLATEAPLILAPAMNRQMWANPATQANSKILRQRGITLWGPADGSQACGETGPGRMLEPDELVRRLVAQTAHARLAGRRVLLTAGPTREPIDPVRFVGNRSSGKMGYALAQSLADLGAEVMLVSGPVALEEPVGVVRKSVETAAEMMETVRALIAEVDIFVATAAVADYRPVAPGPAKIKKDQDTLSLKLVRNPDILAQVAALPDGPFTVGFAAETENLEGYARSKLQFKGLDMIAANQVGATEGGFERDDNALLVLWHGGRVEFPLMPKPALADRLAELIADRYYAQTGTQDSGSTIG